MARNAKTRGTRVPGKDCGLTRIATGERMFRPDPRGNRAERREAKRLGVTAVIGEKEVGDG